MKRAWHGVLGYMAFLALVFLFCLAVWVGLATLVTYLVTRLI